MINFIVTVGSYALIITTFGGIIVAIWKELTG